MKISIRNFSIATVLLWASFVIYLPPFKPMHSMLQQEITMALMKGYGFLFFGVLSGLLMFYRYKLGRIIALILAIIVLCSKVVAMLPNVSQRAYALYILMLQQDPLMVIHNDVILPLFMVFSIFYLMKNRSL